MRTLKNVQNNREHTTNSKNYIPIVGGDFNAELEEGCGTICTSVGKHTHTHTLNGGNKRGDWMKHWLMLQSFTALNTMYRKTHGKQTTCRSPKGTEKQIDYMVIKRRHLKYSKDAEAYDMIHIGSDHRCVMATFVITTPKKDGHRKKKTRSIQQNTTEGIKLKKTLGMRSLSSKKDTKRSLKKFKKKLEPQTKNRIKSKKKRQNKNSSSTSKK